MVIMVRFFKKPLFFLILLSLILAGAFATKSFLIKKNSSSSESEIDMLQWDRPKTDAEWAKDVLAEGLNFRFDYQLDEMLSSHSSKRDILGEDLQKYIDCPECVKYEIRKSLKEEFKNPELEQKVNDMFNERLAKSREEYQMISRSVERIAKEIDLRKRGIVDRGSDLLKITPSMDREREELKKLKSEIN